MNILLAFVCFIIVSAEDDNKYVQCTQTMPYKMRDLYDV